MGQGQGEGLLGGGGVPGLLSIRPPFCWGGGVGAAKGLLSCFLVPKGKPAHGLHPRFVVAEIWADRGGGGGGGHLPLRGTRR